MIHKQSKDGKFAKKMLLILLLASYFLVMYPLMKHFGISCVFLKFFGLPCPGCGMTRAFGALCRLDFLEAAKQNVIIYFMPYVLCYLLFDCKHKLHRFLLSGIGVIAIIQWIIKIVIYLGGPYYVL